MNSGINLTRHRLRLRLGGGGKVVIVIGSIPSDLSSIPAFSFFAS